MIEGSVKKELVDGQELYFLSAEAWQEVFDSGQFQNKDLPKRLIDKIKKVELPLSTKHRELVITLGFFGANREVFSYPLLRGENRYQRIYLEGVKCSNCQWIGRAGNPLVSEVYWGISNDNPSNLLMASARKKFPKINCPNCSSPFDRFFIWAGSVEERGIQMKN